MATNGKYQSADWHRRRRKQMAEYLPETYQDFTQTFPAVSEAYDALASAGHDAGPLDERTRRLVKLGLAVGLGAEGAVRSHARRARAAGISEDEILQVVALAVSTGGLPVAVAALSWVKETLAAQG